MKTLYINNNSTNGRVTDLAGNLLTTQKIVVTNQDPVLFAIQLTESTASQDTPKILTGYTGIRLTCRLGKKESDDLIFSYDTYNEGYLPSYEDLATGKFTVMTNFNAPALTTALTGQDTVKAYLEITTIGPGPNFFNVTENVELIEITIRHQLDDGAVDLPQPPSPTYLTAAEIQSLLNGVADLPALRALPEAGLTDLQIKLVKSEGTTYWYDQAAVSGDEAPDDQTGGTGFWKRTTVANGSITTDKIADEAVTTDKLADNAVTSDKINNAAVLLSKIADIATARLLGRTTAGSGSPEELDAAAVLAMLGVLPSIDEDNFSSNSDQHCPTQQSTKNYIAAAVANLVDSSPATLDTLNELAAALGDDPNFAATMTAALATKLATLIEDLSPQLGGNLDVNGKKITSTANGDIDIEPNGTGNILLGNLKIDADQAVGASQDTYALTYDHSTGLIVLSAGGGGGSGGFLPSAEESNDTAYTLVSGDVGKLKYLPTSGTNDRDWTLTPSTLNTGSGWVAISNRSTSNVRVKLSLSTGNFSTGRGDLYLWPGSYVVLKYVSSTYVEIVGGVF